MNTYLFPEPLIEALLLKRRNRFICEVLIEGQIIDCHCPSTGRIGHFILENIPCLLSKALHQKRKTAYTVEAIALHRPDDAEKQWIGINQHAMNHYVAHYLKQSAFPEMLPQKAEVKREQKLGQSKLDFLVGDVFVEVKMPLQHIAVEAPPWMPCKKIEPLNVTERLQRHMDDLGRSLQNHQRAIMLLCFAYDSPPFKPRQEALSVKQKGLLQTVAHNRALGLEFWQANFKMDAQGVLLTRYFPLKQDI